MARFSDASRAHTGQRTILLESFFGINRLGYSDIIVMNSLSFLLQNIASKFGIVGKLILFVLCRKKSHLEFSERQYMQHTNKKKWRKDSNSQTKLKVCVLFLHKIYPIKTSYAKYKNEKKREKKTV